MIALALLAVGVPMQTVLDDYLMSTGQLEQMRARVQRQVRWPSLFRADAALLNPLFEARQEYLAAAMDTIAERYGAIDAYLFDLGLDDARRLALAGMITAPIKAVPTSTLPKCSVRRFDVHALNGF